MTEPVVSHLTRLDAALPFLLSAMLVVVAAVFAGLVTDRVETVFTEWAADAGLGVDRLPYAFRPKVLAKTSYWIIDTSQAFTALLAPFVGVVVLLRHGASGELALVYTSALLVSACVFVFYLRRRPDDYGHRLPGPLTPIVLISLLLNLAGACVAYAIGP
jgi:uncharacterized protein involved in cysteine biosynthesis